MPQWRTNGLSPTYPPYQGSIQMYFFLAPGPLGLATTSWVGLNPNSCYLAIIPQTVGVLYRLIVNKLLKKKKT